MILAFLVMTAYIPNYIGYAIPTGWVVMLLGAVYYLYWGNSTQLTKSQLIQNWSILAFVFYAALSLIWSPNGYYIFSQLLAIVGIFIVSSKLDIKLIIKGLVFGLIVSDLVMLSQIFGFKEILYVTLLPAGLFVNSNILAEVSTLILILLLINRMWWYSFACLPGLLVSSRATVLSLIGASVVWAWSKSKLITTAFITLGCLVFYIFSSHHDMSIDERLTIWRDTINGFTLFGHGIGSFEYLYPMYSSLNPAEMLRPNEAHNEFIQFYFELGIMIILPIFTIIINWNKEYAPWLVSFAIISCFGFPLHIPATAFMFAIVFGYICNHSDIFSIRNVNIRSDLLVRMGNKRYQKVRVGF